MSAKQANNVIYNGGLQIYSNYDSRIQGIVDNVMLDDSNFPKPNYSLDINYIVSTEDTATGKQQIRNISSLLVLRLVLRLG